MNLRQALILIMRPGLPDGGGLRCEGPPLRMIRPRVCAAATKFRRGHTARGPAGPIDSGPRQSEDQNHLAASPPRGLPGRRPPAQRLSTATTDDLAGDTMPQGRTDSPPSGHVVRDAAQNCWETALVDLWCLLQDACFQRNTGRGVMRQPCIPYRGASAPEDRPVSRIPLTSSDHTTGGYSPTAVS
jgi:hypothetical protein